MSVPKVGRSLRYANRETALMLPIVLRDWQGRSLRRIRVLRSPPRGNYLLR